MIIGKPRCWMMLLVLGLLGCATSAAKSRSRCRVPDEKNVTELIEASRCLVEAGDTAALAMSSTAVQLSPNNGEAWFTHARAQEIAGIDRHESKQSYQKACYASGSFRSQLCKNSALKLHQLKLLDEAAQIYRRILDVDAENIDVLNVYGLCLIGLEKYEAAAAVLERVVAKQPDFGPALLNLAEAYTHCNRGDEAMMMWTSRLQHELDSLRRLWRGRAAPIKRSPKTPVVAIFARTRHQLDPEEDIWSPLSLKSELTGSEEAIIFLSKALASIGYFVEIYGNPPATYTSKHKNIVYRPFYAIVAADPPDVLISWRNFEAAVLRWEKKRDSHVKRYVWLHDILEAKDHKTLAKATNYTQHLHGVFVLSRFHQSLLPPSLMKLSIVTSNAVDRSSWKDGANSRSNFIYAGWPIFGLEIVLQRWQHIGQRVPNATLDVFYGFPSWMDNNYGDQEWYWNAKGRILELVKQPGINYHGMRGHDEINLAYSRAGFLLYPTSKQETSAISVMKAQANGAIPITSRYPRSSLAEVAGCFDLGPDPPRDPTSFATSIAMGTAHNEEWSNHWVDAVVQAANRVDLDEYRNRMKLWARGQYQWSRVAEQWKSVFDSNSTGIQSSSSGLDWKFDCENPD